jgi:hypothetical protein
MPPARHIRFAAAIIGFAALGGGCRDVVQPDVDPRVVAGTYVLESVSGRYAPISGGFVLTLDARAERRVRYSALDTAQEYVIFGTFALHSSNTIDLALLEKCGTSDCLWNVHGTRTDERFTIQYPDPADGPPIIETYRRQ